MTPIIRLTEIRKMNPKQAEEKIGELRVELRDLRIKVKAGGKVENPARIREIRRTIARILTVMREKWPSESLRVV